MHAPLNIALYQPEIPPNTGNIGRLCAANNLPLHIVGKPAFDMDDRAARRAGLDYWPEMTLHFHDEITDLEQWMPDSRMVYFSARASTSCFSFEFQRSDCLVFGPESTGLPSQMMERAEHVLNIPMLNNNVRSLNLATAVGIAMYEALRQLEVLDT